MSAKVALNSHVFPTSAKDGILYIHVGYNYIEIPIPYNYEFPYDNKHDIHGDIMCYLSNKDYKLIIRFNGSVTLYTSENVVIGMKNIEIPNFESLLNIWSLGAVMHEIGQDAPLDGCTLYSLINGDHLEIVMAYEGLSGFVIIPKEGNAEFYKDLLYQLPFYPTLLRQDNQYFKYSAEKNLLDYSIVHEIVPMQLITNIW